MSVTVRRRITRIGIAVDAALLIASVIGVCSGGSLNWAASLAFAVVSIAASLLYLHRSGGWRS